MKAWKLKAKSGNHFSDNDFLAKSPLVPYQYLFKSKRNQLGLFKKGDNDPFILITDSEDFLARFKNYYQERFEISEHGDDFIVPAGYELLYGQVQFDNKSKELEEHQKTENLEEEIKD